MAARVESKTGHGNQNFKFVICLAFSLVELLVVISIISLLMAVVLPVLGKVRGQAKMLIGGSNQRQIVKAATLFASDNDESFPQSMATVGAGRHWGWQEPTMMTCGMNRSAGLHRSMGEYLRPYIRDASIFFCPLAPEKYDYLQSAWDEGDRWDNPKTITCARDPMIGTYGFYWNYLGILDGGKGIFRGPAGPASGLDQSNLLVSCYLGYGHWRTPGSFSSCQGFKDADVTSGNPTSSAYWTVKRPQTEDKGLGPKLNAGYADGHVGVFNPSDAIKMEVSADAEGTKRYPDSLDPGVFYLPQDALP